jgi:hypothetical protein
MARALVVYESVFGNGARIAADIAAGVSGLLPAEAVAASKAPPEIAEDVRLLVVGAPNHGFALPTPKTRAGSVKRYGAPPHVTSTGLREWLAAVRVAGGVRAAAYDTRASRPRFLTRLDRAARTEEKLLRGLGLAVVVPAEHFYVRKAQGPLLDGEEERARRWGEALAAAAT